MERITVNLAERSYPISIGAGLFEDPAYLSQILLFQAKTQTRKWL